MRAKPKLDLGLSAFDALFMDANEFAVQKLPRIYDISIDLIDGFPDHPFEVNQDEDMELLAASVKEQGLITPVTLRPKDDGRYGMVSGHSRKEACKLVGLTTIKADIHEDQRLCRSWGLFRGLIASYYHRRDCQRGFFHVHILNGVMVQFWDIASNKITTERF